MRNNHAHLNHIIHLGIRLYFKKLGKKHCIKILALLIKFFTVLEVFFFFLEGSQVLFVSFGALLCLPSNPALVYIPSDVIRGVFRGLIPIKNYKKKMV